jgi:23S rRNA (cytosine1962-C5)-methyltransferase
MTKVLLKKKISMRIANGHPWVFANEVGNIEGAVNGGNIVEVCSFDGKFIGRGYINPQSQIIVRLLTRDKKEIIDEDFFYNRLLTAWQYKQQIGYTQNCRLIFGEADFIPALVIDKFNDYFVIQTLALGIDVWKPAIVKAIEKIFSPKGIYERNDVPVRELEGLPQQKGYLSIPFDTNIIITKMIYNLGLILRTGKKPVIF